MSATQERRAGVGQDILERLVSANRPAPFGLLQHAADALSQSFAVTDLLVRGSLARGTADRLSDVDFVVGISDAHFGDFVKSLDALVIAQLGAIMPGWRDTIVADMGGLGYVYLVAHEGRLHQLDLYAAPSSAISAIAATTAARELLHRDYPGARAASTTDPAGVAPHAVIAAERSRQPTCTQLLVEVLVLGQMIKKRLTRGETFVAYGENHMLTVAFRNLIKVALAPTSQFYGWYHLPEDVALTPIGRDCLAELSALVTAPAVPTPQTLTEALHRVVAVAERAAPQSVETLRTTLDAYRYYLELP
jgi:hypothetical protein